LALQVKSSLSRIARNSEGRVHFEKKNIRLPDNAVDVGGDAVEALEMAVARR
jgi:hypothetical protein